MTADSLMADPVLSLLLGALAWGLVAGALLTLLRLR